MSIDLMQVRVDDQKTDCRSACLCWMHWSIFFAYAYLLILSDWSQHVLYISVLMIVGGILGAISWVGYSMITVKPKQSSITDE